MSSRTEFDASDEGQAAARMFKELLSEEQRSHERLEDMPMGVWAEAMDSVLAACKQGHELRIAFRDKGRLAERAALDELRGMAGYRTVLGTLRSAHTDQLRMAANAEQVYCGEYTDEAACAADALAAVLKLIGGET